ncbi:hypothetical protein DERF_008208 [Dermatophagoides farinae]|uniref:Hikeshi-like domain-containing protein n=1 Tax=Dermatophagoides farinae TaxID=6954 RepID=A0A922I2X7_DERFA|nr:hypothetical protein DERF_008208 [Dermatophagoides farinae]
MANTFAVIVSGRLVQTDFQQVEPSKFLITIPNADAINHIVVFLTGMVPLPADMAGAVFFSFPDPSSPPSWIYLGYICNEKPSAIFKINKLKQMTTGSSGLVAAAGGGGGGSFGYVQPIISHVAQIGISIESKISVAQMTADPSTMTTADSGTKLEQFATKMAENLYNYCSSFSNSLQLFATNIGANPNQQLVPLSTINDWYGKFMRNFKQNPDFWK